MNFTETTATPFYKKKPFLIISVILLLALLGKMFKKNETQKPIETKSEQIATTNPNAEKEANEKALVEIRKEKKVAEAMVTDANVLYVSVKDDGTKRDGYAEYLCQILKENGSKINWVKVTKVGSTTDPNRDNAYGILLGEAHCK